MPQLVIDFSEIPDNDIPEGEYDAVIGNIEYRQSQSSEFGYLNWEFQIDDGEYRGRKLFMMTSLSPKALWNLKSQFTVLGFESKAVHTLEIDDLTGLLVTPDLLGYPVRIKVWHDEYQGTKRPKVEKIVKSYREQTNEASGDSPADSPKLM